MIKTTLRDKPLNIDFEHNQGDHKRAVPYSTNCTVEYDGDKKVRSSIVALSDNPCRKIGRRISLKRALAQFDFTKTERSEIWAKYFEKAKK